ncbi:MAG: hypothetical protein ABW131_07320 [Candidatus Sedimenticola sp. 6PFRAG5]
MRKYKSLGMLVLAGALCMTAGSVLAADKAKAADPKAAEISKVIAAADAARKKAASVEGEWRDTGKFIKQAKKALESGDYDKAMKLARKARAEGELGYAQAVAQTELKMPAYLKY